MNAQLQTETALKPALCPFCTSLRIIADCDWQATSANDANGPARAYLIQYRCNGCQRSFWVDEGGP